MPVTKSAEKRMRQTVVRTARNRRVKSMVKTAMRRFEEALQEGDRELARTRLVTAVRRIDQAAAKGVIHKNNAARKKSRLTRLFNQSAAG
ncbi:MAG: 30S ribosomal protein S20 [Firmicutes bacterium]|nr:30S ribosomal protein S20 [Bacillota bacterium]